MINRIFCLSEFNTTIRTELAAGLTTFLTMAYIIFLQPAVMSGQMFGMDTGIDFGAVMTATCLAAALSTFIMGVYANYPIAQAPGMGENFFFVLGVIPAAASLPAVAAGDVPAWEVALGVVFIPGIIFLLISLTGIREKIVDAISPSMKNAIAVGIGLFITFIGLQNAGLIIHEPSTCVKLNPSFLSVDLLIFFSGLFLTVTLHARRVRGAILIGIIGGAVLSVFLKLALPYFYDIAASNMLKESMLMTRFLIPLSDTGFFGFIASSPPSIAPTFLKMNIMQALSGIMIPYIIIFLFMDVFDTIGTLIGVSEQAGFIRDNKLPRAGRVLRSDAIGTVAGACMGTGTITSFVESTAGVEHGGRTGLTSVTVALLFIAALFFSPLVIMIGSYPPITAPALIIVGGMMFKNVVKIDWSDYSESFPAFLIVMGIPFSFSIADGMAVGLMVYPLLKLFSGKGKEVAWIVYALGIIILLYFIFIR